jgi:hypothetical protein
MIIVDVAIGDSGRWSRGCHKLWWRGEGSVWNGLIQVKRGLLGFKSERERVVFVFAV